MNSFMRNLVVWETLNVSAYESNPLLISELAFCKRASLISDKIYFIMFVLFN